MHLDRIVSGAFGLVAVALALLVGTPFLILFIGPFLALAGGSG